MASSDLQRPDSVGVILVSHQGERWLPTVISGLAAQTAAVADVVVVDTGSRDASVSLCESAYGEVLILGSSTSYPEAVVAGLERMNERAGGSGPEWIWLLHDDSTPDPGALAALLAEAARRPDADILGPKLREWPSLRRLLEVGVTISGTGRRETGLERAEFDQGQHDDVHEVLAVNTAGMLVRHTVLESLGGFDPNLPVFGNDLDFGWRAAKAGHTTLVVPAAVVFHAEAAHRGARRTPLTGSHTHYQERRAALYTLAVNARGRYLPLLMVRLALGTLIRMMGFLVLRSVREALDEFGAWVSLVTRPGLIRRARRRRAELAGQSGTERDPRPLLAKPWVPYRHGLDFLTDLYDAASNQAADVAERRRIAAAELDPSSMAAARIAREQEAARHSDDPNEAELAFEDTGLAVRFFTNPIAVTVAVLLLVWFIAARNVVGDISGGGLSPVPPGIGDWWGLYLDQRHSVGQGGQGSVVPAAPYLLPLIALGSVFGTSGAVTLLFLSIVPIGLWGAWRLLRVAGRLVRPQGAPRPLLLWGAMTYALAPVVSGAWSQGRLGTVVAAALLPWLAHAALGFADPDRDRRWRAAWRTGFLLALITCFAPIAWLVALVVGLVILGVGALVVGRAALTPTVWGPPATALGVVIALLIPWWVPALAGDGAGGLKGLLLEIGRAPSAAMDASDLALGRWAGLGAPPEIGVVLVVLAVLALVPRATRVPVLLCWLLAAATVVVAAATSRLEVSLAFGTTPVGLGVLVMVLPACWVTAVVLGSLGVSKPEWNAGGTERLRSVAVGAMVAAAVAVPLIGLGWFTVSAPDRLTDRDTSGIPAYMVQEAVLAPERGVLVLRGSVATGVDYSVRRGDGVTLGEDEIIARTPEDRSFTEIVSVLTSQPTPAAVQELASQGVAYIVLLPPVGSSGGLTDGRISSGLDATGGLVAASAEDRQTRAWQVTRSIEGPDVQARTAWWRTGLVGLQLLLMLVVAVLALPTTERRVR